MKNKKAKQNKREAHRGDNERGIGECNIKNENAKNTAFFFLNLKIGDNYSFAAVMH